MFLFFHILHFACIFARGLCWCHLTLSITAGLYPAQRKALIAFTEGSVGDDAFPRRGPQRATLEWGALHGAWDGRAPEGTGGRNTGAFRKSSTGAPETTSLRSVDALNRQFHLIRLLVRMLLGIGLHVAVHQCATRLDELLFVVLLFGILAPVDSLRFLVLVVIG